MFSVLYEKHADAPAPVASLLGKGLSVWEGIVEISKKLDYALRMVCEVAKANEGDVISVRTVAEKSKIPYSFARTIQHELVSMGLLSTMRGPHGGMCLAVDPETTTLLDLVETLEGVVFSVEDQDEDAAKGQSTQLQPVWEELSRIVRAYLGAVTLRQLAVEGLVPVAAGTLCFDLVPCAQSGTEAEASIGE